MSAAATIPADVPAWTVHVEHIRAAVNIADVTLGVTATGAVLANTEEHLRAASATPLATADQLWALRAHGTALAAEYLTRRARDLRHLTAA